MRCYLAIAISARCGSENNKPGDQYSERALASLQAPATTIRRLCSHWLRGPFPWPEPSYLSPHPQGFARRLLPLHRFVWALDHISPFWLISGLGLKLQVRCVSKGLFRLEPHAAIASHSSLLSSSTRILHARGREEIAPFYMQMLPYHGVFTTTTASPTSNSLSLLTQFKIDSSTIRNSSK